MHYHSVLTWDQRHEQRIHILLLYDHQNSSYHLYYIQHKQQNKQVHFTSIDIS